MRAGARVTEPTGPVVTGSIVAALIVGVGWSLTYRLAGAATAGVCAAHVLGGALLGVLLAWQMRRSAPRFETGLLAALLLAGLLPATLTSRFFAELRIGPLLLLWLAATPFALAACRIIARVRRASTWAAVILLLGMGMGLKAQTGSGVFPAHALEPVQPVRGPASRVAVIGLDSADWAVIDPLLAAGRMPHLATLLSRGRSAVLLSEEPTISPVVWNSIFSGRPASEHGIVDWDTAHATNRRSGLVWEMAAAAGLSSVVVNVPGTWPPRKVRGALVAGFPLPNALWDPDRLQNVGSLISAKPRPSPLRTTLAEATAEGAREASLTFGRWWPPRRGRLRHFAIDTAHRRRWLPTLEVRIALRVFEPSADGRMPIEVEGQRLLLPPGGWTPWLEVASAAGPLHVRLRRLEDDALFVTPAFQDPGVPQRPFTSSGAVRDTVAGLGMYVVEPTGWLSADDPGVRDALFEHFVDVERMHLRASLALLDLVEDWRLFVHVITLPDRVSHPFWRFHRPDDYPPVAPSELEANATRVEESYLESDRLLGELLARLGGETTLIVVSDHGSASTPRRYGGHRAQGMLTMAGPGVLPGAGRPELSIYDVTPLVMALLGLPAARDLSGSVPDGVSIGVAPPSIASYEPTGAGFESGSEAKATIDEATRDQLRGLGYIE